MLKLYGGAFSRAAIVKWYLAELDVPFEFVLLDMKNGEHKEPEYLAINPFAKVPAIVDGDFQLWESGAILLYLAEKYGNLPNSPEYKATLVQWVLFANATLGTGVFVEANRDREMPRLMTALNSILANQAFLLGEEFTVADVAVGSLLAYIPIMLKEVDLSPYPAVLDYMKRVTERPAFQKAMQP
ncbi:glutathione S-transferase family protein [Aerosakkonemataceae cyanobacterium BLCC-F154]|uniref:Glutathione S-transferase family protein n=1 Tax=Floridaenema fluviatile BLCC-F154 TaxID=3153640 RepID=A0ABV4YES1_9CYAN